MGKSIFKPTDHTRIWLIHENAILHQSLRNDFTCYVTVPKYSPMETVEVTEAVKIIAPVNSFLSVGEFDQIGHGKN